MRFLSVSIFLFLLQVLGISHLAAQDYHPLPTGPARWDMTRCWYFYPGGWHDRYYVEMDGSDTVLNQRVYKKLYHTTHHAPGTEFDSTYTHFLGGMREEGKKIYMWSDYLCLDTLERLIYDFNPVSTGDTIYTQVLTNGSGVFIPHLVTSLDAVEVNGIAHRRIHLTDPNGFATESWIEGVGSDLGLVYASYWILTDNSYDLNCFYRDDLLQYANPFPAYAYCTAPFPDVECEPVITSADAVRDGVVRLYPNPVSTSLSIQSSREIRQVDVFDMLGKKWCGRIASFNLDMQDLPAGIYVIRISLHGVRYPRIARVIKQ